MDYDSNPQYKEDIVPLDNLIIPIQEIDDNYINILQKQLQEMKRQRKKTESETQFLNTRVNCLKSEEEKTIKQIELTKQKTSMKLLQIQRSQTELKRRIKIKEENRKELESLKKKNIEKRLSIEQGLIMTREYKIKTAIEEARLFKEHQRLTSNMIKGLRHDEITQKKSNNEKIKSQQLINYTKKRAVHLEKKYQVKTDLEHMINSELMAKEETDKKIKKLQVVENDIIKRIQETTQMHKMLIQEFEMFMFGGVASQDNNTINENIIGEENQENYSQGEEEKKIEDQNDNQYNEYNDNSSSSNHQKNYSDDSRKQKHKKRHSYS